MEKLKEKLKDVISFIQSLNGEEKAEAGIIWDEYSTKLKFVINEDNNLINKPNIKDCNQNETIETTLEKVVLPNDKYPEKTITDDDSLKSSGQLVEKLTIDDQQPGPSSKIKEEDNVLSLSSGDIQQLPEKASRKRNFICDTCGAAFCSKGNFNVHLRKHSGEKPFGCTIKPCPKRFNTSSNLRRHLLSHQGLAPYPCSTCGARFTEKKSLVVHARKHTGERPFVCPTETCKKSFSNRWVLSQHLKTHQGTEGRNHLCHQCGKCFTQKSQLKLHEKRHLGIKPNVCCDCDASFATKSDLKRHEQTHSKNLKFVCDQCGKSFTRSKRLKDHLLKHETLSE